MPTKRLSPASDSSSEIGEAPLKRTQRTHEENQERAYIAASRRADRDIEHRIRSALKASECRKKRTGRGLKITREAVLGDEQYESDDDDTARRFGFPATSSCSHTFPAASSSVDRYAEVDALFAKHFPHVQLSSRWTPPQRPPQPPSFPSHPLQVQTAFMPRYQAPPGAATASPLLTPPVSYPLPPAREDSFASHNSSNMPKSRSMSPLALEGSPAVRPASATSNPPIAPTPDPTAAMNPRHSLPLGMLEGSYLDLPPPPPAESSNTHILHPGFLYEHAAERTASIPLMQQQQPQQQQQQQQQPPPHPLQDHIFPTGDAISPSSWYRSGEPTNTGAGGCGGGGGGWHMRSLSLPSALEAFQFSFDDMAPAAEDPNTAMAEPTGVDGSSGGGDISALDVDPVMGGLAAVASAVAAGGDFVGTVVGNVASPPSLPPNEPWADWVDLDGEGPPAVGVKV